MTWRCDSERELFRITTILKPIVKIYDECQVFSNEKGVLRNLAKFTGKQMCEGLFFNKLRAWGMQLY